MATVTRNWIEKNMFYPVQKHNIHDELNRFVVKSVLLYVRMFYIYVGMKSLILLFQKHIRLDLKTKKKN